MQKKKLDQLFQEKFLDFKEAPDNKVWRAIDASLDRKKKKRTIPFWWSLGGIAAALAIAFLLFNPFSEPLTTDEIQVGVQKKSEDRKNIQTKPVDENLVETPNAVPEQLVEKASEQSLKSQEKNQIATKNLDKSSESAQKENSISSGDWSQSKNALVENKSSKSNTHANTEVLTGSANSTITSSDAISNEAQTQTVNTTPAAVTPAVNPDDDKRNFKPKNAVTALAANQTIEESPVPSEVDKKSIFDEIAHQEEVEQNATTNRWSAGPSIAPVYFNAIGEGSPVHSIFVPNSKTGNINLSYGVSVAYAVSKKLTIRSGIHKVDYGYDTEDVTFSSSLNAISSNGQIASIDYASTSKSLIISSKEVVSDKFSTANSSLDVSAKSATRDGFMSQQLGYLELPIEVNYAIVDKKFGVNLIGGVSSLFLIDNAVSLTAGELTTEIGESNNINALNFSANMGLGLNYNFSQKIRFNLEPIFKYQLNTFSEIDGTFRPYSIGVYSGLSFKF
jgi:hypothetical protein